MSVADIHVSFNRIFKTSLNVESDD